MTPREWARKVDAWIHRKEDDEKNLIKQAWLVAKFYRLQTLPALKTLLDPPVEAVELTHEEAERQTTMMDVMAERMKAHKEKKRKREA